MFHIGCRRASATPVVRRLDARAAAIAAAVAAVIVYGSLYPFDFQGRFAPGDAVDDLLATATTSPGRGDLLANLLLYMPLGFFLARACAGVRRAARIGVATLAGSILSLAMEAAQLYDAGRNGGLADVYANTAGACLGATAATALPRFRFPMLRDAARHPFAALLAVCYLGARLYPYVPDIDLHKYWSAVKPLVLAPRLPVEDLYRHTMAWLAVAIIIEALWGLARSRWALPLLATTVLCARVLMVGATLSPAEVAGAAAASLLWAVVFARVEGRAVWIAALFVGAVAVEALRPFHFLASPRPFGWIPFLGLMNGSRELNVQSFFEKVFTYGAMVWLLARAGLTLRWAAVLGGGIVFCLRAMQVYLPGRSAEITDTVILLAMAAMMKVLREAPPAAWVPEPGPEGAP